MLLADPFSLPIDDVVAMLGQLDPPVLVVGGAASAARGPGGNRLVLDGEVASDGAVGVVLPAAVATALVVSQGCRPIGDPMIVTAADRNRLLEPRRAARARPARGARPGRDPDERTRLAEGLHLGIAVDEHRATFGRGDFLVRNVIGVDSGVGGARRPPSRCRWAPPCSSRCATPTRPTTTCGRCSRRRRPAAWPTAPCCSPATAGAAGCSASPTTTPSAVTEALRSDAVAGMFCAGEIGPVGRPQLRARVHGQHRAVPRPMSGPGERPANTPSAGSGPTKPPTRVAHACRLTPISSSVPST